MSSESPKEQVKHSVFDLHAFASSCYECREQAMCVRFVRSFDDENADFCRPCFNNGTPQELGFTLGLFCANCKEAAALRSSGEEV